MHSDTKFGRRGGGDRYTDARKKKKFPGRHSGLRPSEKQLHERRSDAFRHKNTLLITKQM